MTTIDPVLSLYMRINFQVVNIENIISSELVLININKMPQTHEELIKWVIEKYKEKNLYQR